MHEKIITQRCPFCRYTYQKVTRYKKVVKRRKKVVPKKKPDGTPIEFGRVEKIIYSLDPKSRLIREKLEYEVVDEVVEVIDEEFAPRGTIEFQWEKICTEPNFYNIVWVCPNCKKIIPDPEKYIVEEER